MLACTRSQAQFPSTQNKNQYHPPHKKKKTSYVGILVSSPAHKDFLEFATKKKKKKVEPSEKSMTFLRSEKGGPKAKDWPEEWKDRQEDTNLTLPERTDPPWDPMSGRKQHCHYGNVTDSGFTSLNDLKNQGTPVIWGQGFLVNLSPRTGAGSNAELFREKVINTSQLLFLMSSG
jgi:hypothetical protein